MGEKGGALFGAPSFFNGQPPSGKKEEGEATDPRMIF